MTWTCNICQINYILACKFNNGLICFGVKDCGEYFVYKYTHALQVLYNKAELCAVLKISSSFYGKQVRVFVNKTRTKQSNTLKRYSI